MTARSTLALKYLVMIIDYQGRSRNGRHGGLTAHWLRPHLHWEGKHRRAFVPILANTPHAKDDIVN